jgi:uncharacterized protein with HEPN domain
MRDPKERLRDILEAIAAIDRYRKSDRLRQTLLDALFQFMRYLGKARSVAVKDSLQG